MVVLFFSKDRPLQLDAALRSWREHAREADAVRLLVLYKASASRLCSLYAQLRREHPSVDFVPEQDFRADALVLLQGQDEICFVVDDTVFIRDFSVAEVRKVLAQHPDALGFSLRLGRNTTYCYARDLPQNLPAFTAVEGGFLKYRWVGSDHDFAYPLELSSSVYRGREILPLLEQIEFKNPNTLEGAMAGQASRFRSSHPVLLCAPESAAFSIPANKVQEVAPNRASAREDYSAEALARLFAEGQRIDLRAFDSFTPRGCHEEAEFKLTASAPPVPLVSVVTACHDQAQYLTEAVASVVAQTLADWEMIIVNDGSTDQSGAVARALIQTHAGRRIRLLEQANSGPAQARNTGIQAAAGAFILPLDGDDKIAPNFLEQTVRLLETQPDLHIVYTDLAQFGARDDVVTLPEFDFQKHLLKNQLPCCSLFRREVWEQVGGYDANIWGYEDWDFWIRCAARGFRPAHLAMPLFLYRVKEVSLAIRADKREKELCAQVVLNHPAYYHEASLAEARKICGRPGLPLPPGAPKVSVIVPTYNRPESLGEALRSILGQTFQDFEILVVNDNGVEVEHVVLESGAPAKVRYLRHAANRGVAAARNTGLRMARGRYIALLDDDDIFLPNHLATLVNFLQTSGQQAAYTDARRARLKRVDGQLVTVKSDVSHSSDWDSKRILQENFVPSTCFLFERACAISAGGFDESLAVNEDWDFWIRLARVCEPVHLKQVTCECRTRQDGATLSSSRPADFRESARVIRQKYRDQAEIHPGPPAPPRRFPDLRQPLDDYRFLPKHRRGANQPRLHQLLGRMKALWPF